jgi:hypothetical protein
MKTKLSNSAVNKYNECSLCYKLHYIDGVRPVKTSSALVFGAALDLALNDLLLKKDLDKAKHVFQMEWQKYHLDPNIKYFKSDLDEELLKYHRIDDLTQAPEWSTLHIKGNMFIEAYHKEVLPKIKHVFAIQLPISIKNEQEDEIVGFLDFIVKWEDDKAYLMDNKSSKSRYSEDSAKEGQQLPLYHYAVKDEYKLAGIGYIVLIKEINKNRLKVCKKCGVINTSSHKSCNERRIDGVDSVRCNGQFEISINPSVDIQYVFNTVSEEDENRVLELFDQTNNLISNEAFASEHTPIRGKYGYCPYIDYYPGNPDFYVKEKK